VIEPLVPARLVALDTRAHHCRGLGFRATAFQYTRPRPSGARSSPADLRLGSDAAAALLVSHEFPLALAKRRLCSLSPGARARAAFDRPDRPISSRRSAGPRRADLSLDLIGLRALTHALRLWPGGLVVASHDRHFLEELGTDRTVRRG
jgi:hypothetical protein